MHWSHMKIPFKYARNYIWASSWDYGTFRLPLTHFSNTHAQPSSGARCLVFGRTLRLLPYFKCANSEGSGETAWMCRFAWAFAGRLCDKYHNLISWLISLIYRTQDSFWKFWVGKQEKQIFLRMVQCMYSRPVCRLLKRGCKFQVFYKGCESSENPDVGAKIRGVNSVLVKTCMMLK